MKIYGNNHTEGSWVVTFSDMLTLLLTFFVFIIAVSVFKTPEYKEFWRNYQAQMALKKGKGTNTPAKIELIKGLNAPRLNRETENLLSDLEPAFTGSGFDGSNVFCEENKISLLISDDLGFEGGKSELKESIKPMLLNLIPVINKSKFDASIEGHTDNLVSPGVDNMDLSLQRALSVARFLIKSGLSKEKISVSGYGPLRPVASNDTLEGRQRNRRVEVNIIINNE